MKITPYIMVVLLPFRLLAVEIFFTPSTACEDQIIKAISSAKDISAAVYSVNNDKIVSALKDAHKKGTKIRLLTDRLQAAGRSSKVLELFQSGIDVRVHSKHRIEHNKFIVTDNGTAISGSFNWTNPASKENSENCVVMSEVNAIVAYKKRFEELWILNSEEISKARLGQLAQKKERAISSVKQTGK